MKRISYWAHTHKWPARFIIVVIHLLLILIGLFLGDLLSSTGLVIPGYVMYLTAVCFSITFFLYPSKQEKKKYKNFYQRQKLTDGVLVLTTFIMIICIGNGFTPNNYLNITTVHSANIIYEPSNKIKTSKTIIVEPINEKPRFSIKELKKQLKQNIKSLRKEYRNSSGTGKTVYIILASLVAAVLFVLLLGLACNLSCSGADGAAIVVFLLGTALLVFLLLKVIRRINRGPKIKQESKPPEPNTNIPQGVPA